jgi:hypothetical protein
MTDQFPDATKMVLSPVAQAVLDAFLAEWIDEDLDQDRCCLAAALHAAADQVLAATWEGAIPASTTHMLGINWSRDALHAIADELESQ